MNTNLVIVPTRSRPEVATRFIDTFFKNSTISDIVLGIDDDEIDLYPRIDGVIYDINPNMTLVKKLNNICNKYVNEYKTICFIGDDNLIKTKAWDSILYDPLKNNNYGLSYGNDCFQGENLPTFFMITSNIIKAQGFLIPDILIHMYMDNFLKDTFSKLNAIFYNNDVIVEHMHACVNKSEWDDTYKISNNKEVIDHDYSAYTDFLKKDFNLNIEKINKYLREVLIK